MIYLIIDDKTRIDISNCNGKEVLQITQLLKGKDIKVKRIS